MIKISALDHLVLTVADIEQTIAFYTQILGFQAVTFGDNRKALTFGRQKINLHQKGREILPHAMRPTCGSADLCFISETPLEHVLQHLAYHGIPVEEEIVSRTGAMGKIQSVYIRDPDGNLLEISHY